MNKHAKFAYQVELMSRVIAETESPTEDQIMDLDYFYSKLRRCLKDCDDTE